HVRGGRGARGRCAGAGGRRERLGGGGFGGDDLKLPRSAEPVADRGGKDGNGRQRAAVVVPRAASAALCRLLPPMTPEVRRVHVTRARDLFNAGEYWLAHEALETVWRSIISDGDAAAARVWQGLIQAAAALLHQQRGNSHGVATVGRGALEKLAGRQRPDVEVETRSEEHTSELQSRRDLVCRLLLEKKKKRYRSKYAM